MDSERISECLLCHHNELVTIVNFGQTPLANEFSEYSDYLDEDIFDLKLVQCANCKHVQLSEIVDGSRLFRDYLYVAGTSSVNVKHFKDYAEYVKNEFAVGEDDLIVDIGSNDGTLLHEFKELKCRRVRGIDPAENIAKIANDKGIPTIPEFFSESLVMDVFQEKRKSTWPKNFNFPSLAKIITCNNMFAHTKDLEDVVRGVRALLKDDGVFIFENSYLVDILDNNLFDVVYHEHCHTHSITPLIRFFRKFGLKIFDVQHLPDQQGGSIRVFVCRNSCNERPVKASVLRLLKIEKNIDVKVANFAENIKKAKFAFSKQISEYKNQVIDCFGYAAKTTTLFYTFNIKKDDIRCCYEDAYLKQGKYSPGLHIKIEPVHKLYDNPPDVIIVSAWNYAKSIIRTHQSFVRDYGGVFLIPLPTCVKVDRTNIDEYLL